MLRNVVVLVALVTYGGVMFEGGQRMGAFLLNGDGYLEAKVTRRVFDSRDFITKITAATTTAATTTEPTTSSMDESSGSGLPHLELLPKTGNGNNSNDSGNNSNRDLGNNDLGGKSSHMLREDYPPTPSPDDPIPASRDAYDPAAEERIKELHAPKPLKAGSLVNYSDDILIDVQRNPVNPLYVDHTDYGNWLRRQWSTYESGWHIAVTISSRSKRCQGFECPAEAVSSLDTLSECIAVSAPGCALSYELEMVLGEQAHACCRDEGEVAIGALSSANYTWLLPTPRIAVELANKANVTTVARFRRPYYGDGIHKADVANGGFGISKRNGVCADYVQDPVGDFVYKIGNPGGCQPDETGVYNECIGWASAADGAAWDKTNADQLLFVGSVANTNCISLASQNPLTNATIRYGTIIYPSPGSATRDGVQDRQLDFGYSETPDA